MNFTLVKSKLTQLTTNATARNALSMFTGHGMSLVLKAAYFIVIARKLGSNEYGAFVAVTSLCAVLGPFVGLGTGNLVIKYTSRNEKLFPEYWGNCLLVTAANGVVLLLGVVGLSQLIVPKGITLTLILLVTSADLLFARILEGSGQAFQAIHRLSMTAKLNLTLYALRLVGALVLAALFQSATAVSWAGFYLASSVAAAVAGVWAVNRHIAPPRLALTRVFADMREGVFFSFALAAQTTNNDLDKTMLARLSTLHAVGIYAAAYRVIDVTFSPVRAVLFATYPNFFRHGANGIGATRSYALRMLGVAGAYAAMVCVTLLVFAPALPLLLGSQFRESTEALRWLAPLPFFKSLQFFLADSLSGAGYQKLRSLVQGAVAGANVLLNLWLIPAYSWRGAAWASLVSDGSMVLVFYCVCTYLAARERGMIAEGCSEQSVAVES